MTTEPSFAEFCLVQLDRLKRATDELEAQLRGADEVLLAARMDLQEKFETEQVVLIENKMLQSVGVNLIKHEGKIMIQLVMRDQEANLKIMANEREEVVL